MQQGGCPRALRGLCPVEASGWPGGCPETSSSLQQIAGMLPVLPELPPGVFGSDQILSSGVCSVSSRSPRHHLDKLDVFGMYQMEIPASPNFLSKCFVCVAVKHTSANQQLLLWLLCWQTFQSDVACVLPKPRRDAHSGKKKPCGLSDQLHQTGTYPEPSVYFYIILGSLSDHDPYVDKIWC